MRRFVRCELLHATAVFSRIAALQVQKQVEVAARKKGKAKAAGNIFVSSLIVVVASESKC